MKLLDLFCGAGGGAKGYADAGFDDIIGVDTAPQHRYPYKFFQTEALKRSSKRTATSTTPSMQARRVRRIQSCGASRGSRTGSTRR